MIAVQTSPLELSPYIFQPAALHWYDMREDGCYVVNRDLLVKLGERPRTQKGRDNPGCCGDHWVLSESGDLLVLKGYAFNGPSFVDDASCRMLASMVHDILCEAEAIAGGGCYSYWRRQAFYGTICAAQGEVAWFAACETWALRAFNWCNMLINRVKARKRARRKACMGCRR